MSESIIPFINRSEILLIRTRSERNVQKPARNENTPIIIRSYSGSNKLLFRLQSVYIQNLSDHHRTCQTLKNSLISRPTAFRTFRLYSVRLRLQRICTELFTERLPVKSDAIPDYSACIPNYSDRILSVFRPFRLYSEHVPVAHQTAIEGGTAIKRSAPGTFSHNASRLFNVHYKLRHSFSRFYIVVMRYIIGFSDIKVGASVFRSALQWCGFGMNSEYIRLSIGIGGLFRTLPYLFRIATNGNE